MRSARAVPGRLRLSWPSGRELRRAAHRHAPDAAAALPSLTLLLTLLKPAVQGLPQKGAHALGGLSSYLQRTREARPRRADLLSGGNGRAVLLLAVLELAVPGLPQRGVCM